MAGRTSSFRCNDRRLITRSVTVLLVITAVIVVIANRDDEIHRDLVDGIISFIPRLVVGCGVFVLALILGRLGGVVAATALRDRSAALARRLRTVIVAGAVIIGLLVGLDQMGVRTGTLVLILAILLGGTALGSALALGLGSLPLTGQIAAGKHVEDRFRSGDLISAGELTGSIVSMGLTSVRIVDQDGDAWEIPHTVLLEAPVRVAASVDPVD